jgi:hypothetical protein
MLIVIVVALATSAGLRWRYGTWTPLGVPEVFSYNGWRYGVAWDGDFESMNRGLRADGEQQLRAADLREVPDNDDLPFYWRVFVAERDKREQYPAVVSSVKQNAESPHACVSAAWFGGFLHDPVVSTDRRWIGLVALGRCLSGGTLLQLELYAALS